MKNELNEWVKKHFDIPIEQFEMVGEAINPTYLFNTEKELVDFLKTEGRTIEDLEAFKAYCVENEHYRIIKYIEKELKDMEELTSISNDKLELLFLARVQEIAMREFHAWRRNTDEFVGGKKEHEINRKVNACKRVLQNASSREKELLTKLNILIPFTEKSWEREL